MGEQYVELQPQVDDARTSPSPPRSARRTPGSRSPPRPCSEPGDHRRAPSTPTRCAPPSPSSATRSRAPGPDLQRIIDTGNSFLETANDNFDVTSALIRDSNTVLQRQVDSASALRTFASRLKLFTGTLAASDPDLRRRHRLGLAGRHRLRTFLEQNGVELGDLINNLVTTGEVVTANLPGIEQLLVVYPYIVEGGYTVVSKSPDTGLYDAHFGLILTTHPPATRATRAPTGGSRRSAATGR